MDERKRRGHSFDHDDHPGFDDSGVRVGEDGELTPEQKELLEERARALLQSTEE